MDPSFLENQNHNLSINLANAPLPRIFMQVITGSNNIYRAVISDIISALKPRCASNTGSITIIPPPGTAATENLANIK